MERRLSRGLEALLGKGGLQVAANSQSVQTVPVSAVMPNPHQPRRDFDETQLAELKGSIQRDGLLQPIVVRRTDSGYELIAGERRLRACRALGMQNIPALVRSVEHDQQLVLALVENIQRSDLNAVDEAIAFRHLQEGFGLTHDEIAHRVGRSRVSITNTLRLLELPPVALTAVSRGTLSAGHARALLPLGSSPNFEKFLNRILEEGLSVRQTERVVRELIDGSESSQPAPGEPQHPETRPSPRRMPALEDLEDRLRARWGVLVHVRASRRGGEVSFRCSSREELNNLIERLESALWKSGPSIQTEQEEGERSREEEEGEFVV